MTDVVGTATMSGPELANQGPDNRYELIWVSAHELDALTSTPQTSANRSLNSSAQAPKLSV